MKKIYYNFEASTWEIDDDTKQYTLGHNNHPLNPSKISGTRLSFKVNEKNTKVGPLIGVLIGETESNSPIGNTKLLKSLTKDAINAGAILFAFTPQAVNGQFINGFLYHPSLREWVKMNFPIPDVIYNRTPYRIDEQEQSTKTLLNLFKSNKIPFFNHHFFNKNEVYQALLQNKSLVSHIPKTTTFHNFEQLKLLLEQEKKLYVKPTTSHKGNGIFTLEFNSTFTYKSNHANKIFVDYTNLTEFLDQQMALHQGYVLQQYIEKETFENCPFDLRVLVHHYNDKWNITGIGIRCAAPGNVTTHVPSGGKILYEDMLQVKLNKPLLSVLATNCGEQLNKAFGPVKEFSLDIGIDTNGHYWLFEANSRPMTFDEPHIKQEIPISLLKALLEETPFQDTDLT